MSNMKVTLPDLSRAGGASFQAASSPSACGANGAKKAIRGAAFTWMWYRHLERLTSQSERPPS